LEPGLRLLSPITSLETPTSRPAIRANNLDVPWFQFRVTASIEEQETASPLRSLDEPGDERRTVASSF